MISVGWSSVSCSSTTAEQVEAVAQRAGHGDGVQAGELVGDEIVVGDPALAAEVARVRPGVDRAHRHDEAQAVGRCHLAAAPAPGQRRCAFCAATSAALAAVSVSART